jgi:hypothetical protein
MPDPRDRLRKELDEEDNDPSITDLPPREVEEILRDRRERFIELHGDDSSDPPPPPPEDPA